MGMVMLRRDCWEKGPGVNTVPQHGTHVLDFLRLFDYTYLIMCETRVKLV